MEPLLKKPLEKADGKVYQLSQSDIDQILAIRGLRTELDPGMGGVSPRVLEDLLRCDSNLVSVDIALTSACNFRCIHCYRPGEEWGKDSLDFETVSNIIQQSQELGVRFFVLTGGEPLMYESHGKTYFDVVDKIYDVYRAANKEVHVLTFTDVALIDEWKAQELAKRKVALCLKRDTLDDSVQNIILGVTQGAQQMKRGYEHLFQAGYGRNDFLAVSVNQVLRKGAVDTLSGAINLHVWIRENGMEHSIVPIHYCGEAIGDEQHEGINSLEVKVLYDILAKVDAKLFNDPWAVYSAFPKNKTCNRPGRGVHIRATGKVTSCSESPLISEYIFGNVHDRPLGEMIKTGHYSLFQDEFLKRKGEYICNPDVCDLNANYLCRGGCATRSAYSRVDTETGLIVQNTDMKMYAEGREDPLCPGWTVLAKQQDALKDGIYEEIATQLLEDAELESSLKSEIFGEIVAEFNALDLIHS